MQEIAKITPKPVTHVILTHSDPDHVNGLVGFPKGLTIIAQENCKKEMEDSLNGPQAQAALRDYLPTQVVTKNEDVTIDGVHLRLLHYGPAHTNGDLMIYMPDQKIVYAGDILTLQFPYPLVHREKNGTSEGWVANMKGMVALDTDTFVPGHGDIQNKAAMQKKLADVEARRAEIKKLFDEGKSLNDVRAGRGAEVVAAPGGGRGGAGAGGEIGAAGSGAAAAGAGAAGGGGRGGGGFNPMAFTEVVYRETSEARPFEPHDFNGAWQGGGGVGFRFSATVPPMTPWGHSRYDAAEPGLGPRGRPLGNDPIMICDPIGYPRVAIVAAGYGLEIVQNPKEIVFDYSWFWARRIIWTDGRKLPQDPELSVMMPRYYGYSVGHWEGNTLVVQGNDFDDRSWLDDDGLPHSADMLLEETYTRVNHDTIQGTMKISDPTAYLQPFMPRTFAPHVGSGCG